MSHIRPLHCPHCGSIDYFETYKSEPIDKIIKDGESGTGLQDVLTARSKHNAECSFCENKYGVKFKHIHKSGEEEIMFQVSRSSLNFPQQEFTAIKFGYLDNINIEYEVTVRKGPHVNITILPEDEYDPFKKGKRFFPLDDFTEEEVIRKQANGQVSPGNYYFIVHNTTDEVVQVEFQLTGAIVYR